MNKKDADAHKDDSNIQILIREDDPKKPSPGTGVRGLIRDGQPVGCSESLLRTLAARNQDNSEKESN